MDNVMQQLSHLSPEQRELLALLLEDEGQQFNAFPLSFAQQRLWFLDQLTPGGHAYLIPLAFRLIGRLDAAALHRSLNEIVRRHAVLRTTFPTINGQPIQQIAPTLTLALPQIDLRALPTAEREAETQRLALDEAQRPFDLQQGPLVRAQLLQLGSEEHVLLLSLHHIIGDGWSVGLLIRELGALYPAQRTQQPSPLRELAIQYADYAEWQRQWLQGETLDAQLSFWKAQLADAPAVLNLPLDRPRPAVQSFDGADYAVRLPVELTQALHALSRQSGATLFMTLLASFQILLQRYTLQDDLVIGTPVAGRTRAETEALIGCFINTLALRSDLSGAPTVRELIQRVRDRALQAFEHQDLPFEKLVEELHPDRNLSLSPLFQTMFVLQNAPLGALELPGLKLEPLEVQRAIAKFDLTLELIETAEGLQGTFEYNAQLFDETTIARMAAHWRRVLAEMVAQPDRRLAELALLTQAERRQQLVEWNATAAPIDDARPVHVRFAEQAARTPDAAAVIVGEERLSYAELNRRANQLAHHLRGLGVGPETRVGIFMERSFELTIGLLGALKAGAAYIPLDPSYPAERLQFMLSDAQAPLVITHARLVDRLPASEARTLDLDAAWPQISLAPATEVTQATEPDHLAYIIYTSGSTGQPKGAMITHHGLINYLDWAIEAYNVADGQGAPVHSPLGFDLTVTSLFTPLLAGRPVRLLPEGQGIEALTAALAARDDYSLVKITPAHLDILRHALRPDELPGQTRAFVIGGEALLNETIAFWRTHAPQTRLINEYGPTETVVGCCVYDVPPTAEITGAVPIGRPIANTQLYILDAQLQPIPIGVAGELYIGGDGLARGYLDRPALTAERFTPDPFSARPGSRLYKTGDLARYRPDGVLEFLGRIDHQIKLRGFRIEIGEIETVLQQHPDVQEAVAIVREDAPGDKRLVAYVVAGGQGTENKEQRDGNDDSRFSVLGSQLRQFLAQRLPEYMIPSAFVTLPALPLTANGKVDRKLLPAPDQDQLHSAAYVAPRDELETTIAAIWADVLSVTRVGIHDNFFALGGHSLLAVKVIAGLHERCQIELPLRRIFEAPTVAELAASIVAEQAAPASAPIERLDRGPSAETLATLDQLSADDVDALLSQMLADKVHLS
jgi:amino acid adenylation domain-containing protein